MKMSNPPILFSLPILSKPSAPPIGTIVCTTPAPEVYLLTFTAFPDNRLVTGFCQAFILALDIIEAKYPSGVVVTTSGIPKFYSNGLNLDHVKATPGFWDNSLAQVFKRLLLYPMPTVALINGHAFAGGLMTAMYHDYRIFNGSRGFLCINELEFGVPLKHAMSSIFRQKLPSPLTYRSLVLEAHRFAGPEALSVSLVDGLGGMDEVVALIKDRDLTTKGKTGIYGLLKAEMYRETLGYLDEKEKRHDVIGGMSDIKSKEMQRMEESLARVREWERNIDDKAKL